MPSASDRLRGRLSLREAEPLDVLRRVRRAQRVHQADRDEIARADQRFAQPRRPVELARHVLRPPGAFERRIFDHDRRIVDHEAGVKPFSSAAEYRNGLNAEPG